MRLAFVLFGFAILLPAQETSVDFDRDVRPILAANCFQCHGPDSAAREAGLRLDDRAVALSALASGERAIVPGDVARSALVARIRSGDPDVAMPPPESGRSLAAAEKDVLSRWIAQGAPWQAHWAFVTPSRAAPTTAPSEWIRSPLDRFVVQRLEREGLAPSPEADPPTLARRAALDLTGLPPSPEELEAFLRDRRPDAFERYVDGLLSSPRYGEHMARFWLDAARYGDTHGLHLDNYREMWPYRDWVVDAFNRNLSYDRFVTEQLAGDLLPDATLAQRIASGFNRCHVTTNEGGSIKEEVLVRNVVDRTATFGTVGLGLTVGCAQCHDHKFDPISQREFYSLYAFFNNLDANPMDGNAKAHAPVLKVPTDGQREELASLREQRRIQLESMNALADGVEYREPSAVAPSKGKLREVVWLDDALPEGAVGDGDGYDWQGDVVLSGTRAMRSANTGRHQHYFRWADRKLRVAPGDVAFVWVWLDPKDPPRELMVQFNAGGRGDGEWEHRAIFGDDLIPWGTKGTSGRRRLGDLPKTGRWVRLDIPIDAVGLQRSGVVHGMAFTQFGGTVYWDRAGVFTDQPQAPEDFVWIDDEAPVGAKLQGDGKSWRWVKKAKSNPVKSGQRALRRSGGNGLNQDFFTGAKEPLIVRAGDRLFAHAWLDPKNPPNGIQLQFHSGNWNHRVRWGAPCHGPGAKNGADHRAGDLPATGEWVRLEVALKDVGLQDGDALDGWAFTQVGGTVFWDVAGVRTWSPPTRLHLASLQAWELLAKGDGALPKPVRDALAVAKEKRTPVQRKRLLRYYLINVHEPSRGTFEPHIAKRRDLGGRITGVERAIPTTLVMRERKEPRPAHVLERGEYDKPGEPVSRATPGALPPMNAGWSRDRLGLARWVTMPSHPLTARVAVNRFWQQLFGTGLVKTSEDFGNQGERPTHPELMDWLAVTFVEDGWDVKGLLRRIVLSSTYRQGATVTDELRRRDPENRLLARGPRFRLDAETLRDQALALSGLLVEKQGGPSVKPPQPDGLWHAVGYSSSNTVRFKADQGPDKVYRRTLYTFFKRTAPPPQMATFDAPSREECRVRRERTNTPLQALLLLNDPQYLDAAKGLGLRLLRHVGTDEERVHRGLRLVTCREPDPQDVRDVLAFLRAEHREFTANPADAARISKVGTYAMPDDVSPVDAAAWTLVGNLLLNLDAVITKG